MKVPVRMSQLYVSYSIHYISKIFLFPSFDKKKQLCTFMESIKIQINFNEIKNVDW